MRFLFCFLFTKIPAFWRRDVESYSGRSTSTNHASLAARVLGTFSHSSRFPIACVLRTCLLDGSEAVNVSQSRFACSSRSWDVFAFEPFPNRLRPLDLPLGRLRSGQRQPITLRLQLAFLGRFRIRAVSQSPASFGLASWTAQKRSTSANHASLAARVLGTFSHSSRFPIACVLRTCLLDGSEFNIAVAFDLAAGL